jgi:hypothetical protein
MPASPTPPEQPTRPKTDRGLLRLVGLVLSGGANGLMHGVVDHLWP